MPAHGAPRPGLGSAVKLGLFPISFDISRLLFLCILVALFFATNASAQAVVNGQVYTAALAIVDAPQPGSTYGAGSNIPIAIDVSGNGRLSTAAQLPGSGMPTSLQSLELYLVSSQTNLNISVSSSGLLLQEAGSTVKHINFRPPDCVPAGAYNLTVYESSYVDGSPYFSITPLPIVFENTNTAPCDIESNPLQVQPQPSSPPPTNPWLSSTVVIPNTSTHVDAVSTPVAGTATPNVASGTSLLLYTVTVGPSGVEWPFTTTIPTESDAAGQAITRTVGGAGTPTTVTVVLASLRTETMTLTGAQTTATITTTFTSLSTTTVVMDPTPGSDSAGFFPVSAARPRSSLLSPWIALLAAVFFVPML